MNPKQYREHLYHQRSHPQSNVTTLFSPADSFSSLYISLFAFVAVEYYAELHFDKLPSGIFFPVGFLFFWAFYYTYCQPGFLEQKLSSERKWDLFGIPTTLMSTCIWFVKIVFVELTENVVVNLLGTKTKPQPRVKHRPPSQGRTHAHSQSRTQSQFHEPHRRYTDQRRDPASGASTSSASSSVNGFPREVNNALAILGIPYARDWNAIQRRYRELAKQYHPDLNPELTTAGNRFMIYDAAYRKLEMVKSKYFVERRSG